MLRLIEKFGEIEGTDIPSAVKQHFAGHDRVVVVTDEQTRAGWLPSNCHGHWGGMPETRIDDLVPADVPVYMWNMAGHRAGATTSGSANRHTFGGLTDAAFGLIPLLEAGADSRLALGAAAARGLSAARRGALDRHRPPWQHRRRAVPGDEGAAVRYDFDVLVVGGGIVGLSTAYALTRARPGLRLGVLEKEDGFATHQSGRNSGVIHSGVYYRPGSLKAGYAVGGAAEMVEFCREQGVPYEVTGKLIVATERAELPRLHALAARGRENGIPVTELG